MCKKYLNIRVNMPFLLLFFFIFLNNGLFSQVTGINTTTPRKTLEVNGTTKISNNLIIGRIDELDDADDYTFLMQEDSDKIRELDVTNPVSSALGYMQDYNIEQVLRDWLLEFDTGIDVNGFVMIVISSSFNLEVGFISGGALGFALPSVQAFKKNGTWHLKADYPAIDPVGGLNGTWSISTLIVSNDLIKQFPVETVNMANATTSVAVTPILD